MIVAEFILLFLSIISYSIGAVCLRRGNECSPTKVVFFHTKKCGGWAVAHYFRFLNSQAMNQCHPQDKMDWRCDMNFLHDTSPEQQCNAFNKFAISKYNFSHVEEPILVRQIFPNFITFLTVLRHPIERLLSSYRMKAAQFPDQIQYWNMKAWLSGRPVNIPKNISSFNSVYKGPYSASSGEKLVYLKTSHLEENYMVKWFSGRWNPSRGVRATSGDLLRAKQNIDKFSYVVFTDRLNMELPVLARLLNYSHAPRSGVEARNVAMYNKSVPEDLKGAARIFSNNADDEDTGAYDETFTVLPTQWNSYIQRIPEFSQNDGTYELALKLNSLDINFYDYARKKFGGTLNTPSTVQESGAV